MNIRILGALLVAATVAAPSWAADKEQRQMMADLRILQEQTQQLQNLIGALSQSVNDALKGVNQRLDEQANANRKSFADEKLVIDNAASDLRVLKEKVDDNSVRVGSLTQELDALRKSVAGISAPRPGGLEPDGSTGTPDGTNAGAGGAGIGPGTSPQKLLDGAMGDYYAGHYDLAVLGFETYINSFPQSPQADYAQFYVGSSHFMAGNYPKAIDAFSMLIKNYGKSGQLPDAYVKIGQAYKTMKDNEKARQAFDYVIKNYPDSIAATMAQQNLSSLPKR